MEEEDRGMSRSNTPKIRRHAEGMESLLMRLLSFGTKPMIQESTIDGGGGSSSSESPSSSAETLKMEPTPSVKMEDSVLMRLLRSRRKPMIQESTNAGVGDFSSGESPSSPAEILKAEPTPYVNMEDSLLMLFLRPRTKPTIQHSANYGVGGSSSSGSPSPSAETLKTESVPSASFSDFDGFPELERQFSRENLQLIPTHFPSRDRTKGKMCREVLRTGSCSMGSMCSFSHHQQPPFAQTETAAPPIAVERPLLLVPSPPPLRPLQSPPMAVRMPLRQFLQLQTGGASESCREEEEDSGSGAASAAANGGSSTTTADTAAEIKVDSSPVGGGSGILSVSTQSAELPQRQPDQTPKYCDEEDGGGGGGTASGATNAGYTTTTTNADTKLPPTQTHKSSNEEAAGCRDTASSSTPGAAITTTTIKADTKLPPAQTSKSSNEEAAAGSDTASSSTIAGSSSTTTEAGNDTASTSAFSSTPGTATIAGSSTTSTAGSGTASTSTSASSSTPGAATIAGSTTTTEAGNYTASTSAFSSTPGTATIAGSSTTSTAGSGTASTSTSASSSTPGAATIAGSITITTDDWSPMDDGIPITREEVNRFIEWFLYDPNRPRRRRLPAFQDICTDADAKND